ncbi:hypothetical protein [Roseibacillus persicicus]|uniref:hypothetical protein n=1 Tax=Roseibacillus persicicus TaxID=454148 RepID=UPI00280CC5E7|nr:hypothetical protein [Roseibacillus persicicus]MDQ8192683.1 hypothetical protein [Roseibacillus persicicus]
MNPGAKPSIDELEAIELAARYIAENRDPTDYGEMTAVSHKPPITSGRNYTGQTTGSYYVEFAYVGIPVPQDSIPRRDHPTVVVVNDDSGECTFMLWM